MDALTHAIEAYTSRAAEPLSDACALYAAELIASHLHRAVADGRNVEARSALLLGSLIAGIAFSHSDVGAVHCIAEALGGVFDIPHGVCNAVCLPEVMSYCKAPSEARYARLGRAMGCSDSGDSVRVGAEKAVRFVRDLAREVGLPEFRSFGVPPAEFASIARKSTQNGSNRDNIPVLTEEDYLSILRSLDSGK
jgi:alcohol dehydrogenase